MKKLSLYIFLVLMWCNVGVAEKVGYIDKVGAQYSSDSGVKQTVGIRSVQKSFESAKCIIVNVVLGVFPKSTI